MSKLDDLIRNGGEKRLMELFEVLDNEDTGNIDDVYRSVQLAMKLILSPHNPFDTTCVKINGVDYYNNNSEISKNNSDMSPQIELKVEKIMSHSRNIDNQNRFKTVNSNLCKFNKVLFS